MTAKQQKAADKSPSFEKSLERLEAIVEEMEGGELKLEKMIAHFEEGQKLIKVCSSKLNEVERKIETLLKKGDELVTEPFEDEDGSDADGDGDDELF